MLQCIHNLLDSWKYDAREIVIFYTGHGVSIGEIRYDLITSLISILKTILFFADGNAYLCPVDASSKLYPLLASDMLLGVNKVIGTLIARREKDDKAIIFILDCCRSEFITTGDDDLKNPLWATFKEVGTAANVAILYSTAQGQTALDRHRSSDHSPYTEFFLEYLEKDLSLFEIDTAIRRNFKDLEKFRGIQVYIDPFTCFFPVSFHSHSLISTLTYRCHSCTTVFSTTIDSTFQSHQSNPLDLRASVAITASTAFPKRIWPSWIAQTSPRGYSNHSARALQAAVESSPCEDSVAWERHNSCSDTSTLIATPTITSFGW